MMNLRFFQSFCMVFLCALLTAAPAFSQERLSVTATTANIRTGPGTSYDKAWQAEKNYPVVVMEKKDGWVKFKDYEGDEGWIHGALLSATSTVIVKKTRVNVRSGPGTSHPVVFEAEKGVPFEVIKNDGDWLQIKHADGDAGWIYRPLVW